jgi:hypothetical protein
MASPYRSRRSFVRERLSSASTLATVTTVSRAVFGGAEEA